MTRCRTQCALVAVAACCLLAGATGCQAHRTGRGFVLRSQWSLEYGDTEGSAVPTTETPSEVAAPGSARSLEQISSKPELLPWRGRLKNHRLAARLANPEPSDSVRTVSQEVVLAATDSKRWQPPPAVAASLPKSSHDEPLPLLAAKPSAPTPRPSEAVLSLPESAKRPDLVLD